jgi:RHS repeat-associated protein
LDAEIITWWPRRSRTAHRVPGGGNYTTPGARRHTRGSVRAYDPSVGRCISRDPLGRAPLFFADQPYAYAGNNPLVNVDPSGQRPRMLDGGDGVTAAPATHTAHWGQHAHIVPAQPRHAAGRHRHTYLNPVMVRPDYPAGMPLDRAGMVAACAQIDNPSWCSRFFSYNASHDPVLKSSRDFRRIADYYYAVYYVGNVQRVEYWVAKTGQAVTTLGLNFGFTIGLPVGMEGGFGVMGNSSSPTAQAIHDFLLGLSVSATITTWIGVSVVANRSGWAIQFGLGTYLLNHGVSVGIGMDDPCASVGSNYPDWCWTAQNYD